MLRTRALLQIFNRLCKLYLIIGPEASFTRIWSSRCSATSWSSDTSVWWSQTEGTTIGSKSHPQLLSRGTIVSPVLHGKILQKWMEEVQWNSVKRHYSNTFSRVYSGEATYSVEVDQVTGVMWATVQRAVVSSEALPGSMEVIGHHIDEVQFPGEKNCKSILQTSVRPLEFISHEMAALSLSNLSNLISSIDRSLASRHCSSQH